MVKGDTISRCGVLVLVKFAINFTAKCLQINITMNIIDVNFKSKT